MLSKLLKYELRATARMFLPLYGLLIVFSGLNRLFMVVNSDRLDIPQGIAMTIYFFVIIGICVMTLVVTIQRFYKNLMGDEGYLMFTLPVTIHQHVWAKAITAMFWNIFSVVAAAISILILFVDQDFVSGVNEFFVELGYLFNDYAAPAYAIALEIILLTLASLLCGVFQIYSSISIGHLCSKHRVMAALGAYMGINIVQQILVSIIMFILFPRNYFSSEPGGLFYQMPETAVIQITLVVFILYVAAITTAFYFVTQQILKKKLNLE